MKLILLRHAKSDWADPLLGDHDRPLNARGRAAAPRIGRWLRDHGHLPTRILCSTSTRTRETLDRLALPDTPTEFRPDLYLAPADTILALAATPADTLLILAHNDGLAEAARRAVTTPPAHEAFARFPTCACLVLDRSGGLPGHCLAFTVPRDLQ
jgi:phosphohistidine phosphatase